VLDSHGASTADDTLAATLESLDDATNYCDWIFSMARPYLDGPILEVGAGSGTFVWRLAQLGPVTAVEPSEQFIPMLRRSYGNDERISLIQGVVDDVPDVCHFGTVVMFNVLEHIEGDAATLKAVFNHLRPGGTLVLWVPAFQLLFSRYDELLGHHRRYRKQQLRDLVSSCGFSVLDARYVNAVGWFSWVIVARLLRRIPDAHAVAMFDRMVPAIRAVERVVRAPFGQSVFLAARKPSDRGD
jgi:SAM-dependent methyltransferase